MEHSRFPNPSGLNEEGHYSTAADMARLARAVLEHETLARIVSTRSVSVAGRSLTNHNKLLWQYEGCTGLKTGYTEAAGRTLVSSAERDGQTLIAVTLNDRNDWADHAALFDYGFACYPSAMLALAGREVQIIRRAEDLDRRRYPRILFALPLDEAGQNFEYFRMLARLRRETNLLEGCTGGLIVDGPGELYTKSTAAELALAMNQAGCALVGRPLVEATGSLANFRIQAKNLGTDPAGAYQASVAETVQRLEHETFPRHPRPNLVVLHASSHHTSNTMALWGELQKRLSPRWQVEEIGLRNGTLSDCSGCPYTMCLHFGERGGCFYGGVMSEEVYPAVRRADALILMCPNYNDALSANLTAFINRLTALFRQTRFYDKAVFALVVSGYSGSDTVARQLISALNMNKSFYLPPRFALLETANAPGEALSAPGIQDRLDRFAAGMEGLFAENKN